MGDEKLKEVFNLFSKDKGKKKIPAQDIGMVVRSSGLTPTQKQLQAAIVGNGVEIVSGDATFDQVKKIVAQLQNTRNSDIEGSLRRALEFFDADGADTVAVTEISHVLQSFGEKMKSEDTDEIFRQADVDGFGQVQISEFAAMLAQAVAQAQQ
eukprot:m.476335 g.476335  ORF g.476335 m.476335 type:complete len:153 (-) comp20504_c0_seq1:29-487(-)